ncbi:dienelactone hydrolase [Epidermidibacterium keratini]|uniref:Dienelactone hydrolase n=1 Tax=Epidermidibacterium keratini TaxID=1891644 RepID=A0A7L4YMN0_9ACTN|nr:dienelactone hydrolase family protein [Epidermidibacterium keratini]QHC00406.1 dienelactone hydrolase [Epidermidibacterium keratini]
MAEVVLFHHVLGLTPGVTDLADRLRAAGHSVHTPDLFEGKTFDSIEAGLEHVGDLGFGSVLDRGSAAVDGLPENVVYAGISLGVLPAQMLTQRRDGALGGIFLESCVPASEFGPWPTGVPAQVHGMDRDPSFAGEGDIDNAMALAESEPSVVVYTYPGDGHLFTDSSWSAYDAEATDLVLDRVLAFLAER